MSNPSRSALVSFAVVSCLGLSFATRSEAGGSWPAGVSALDAKAGVMLTTKGELGQGKPMDLAWAANSSVACFPATRFDAFRGNHVLYGASLPKDSTLTITAVPDDPKTDLSVYAYTMGTTDFTHVAPNVPSVVSCEASYDFTGKPNPGATEKVTLNATTNPYNVVIGVAGAKGVATGGYTLKLELKSKSAPGPSTALVANALTANANGITTVNGKLEDGAKVDLAFAAKSAVACWPATRDTGYSGNHVLYRTSLPPYSNMTITATPGSGADVGVYAYLVGTTDTSQVPPNVSSVVTCEAASSAGAGQPESVKLNSVANGYVVYIGVVGAAGASTGAFKVDIETRPKK